MHLKQIQKFIVNYLVIFAIVTIFNVILSQLLYSQVLIDWQQFVSIMLFSLVGTLPSILLQSSELSKTRLIVHFVVLEFSVVSLGVAIGAVKNLSTATLYIVVVALIYVLVRFLCWKQDKTVANQINEKLKSMKSENDNDNN